MSALLAVFGSRRMAATLLLGFASGLPLALTSGTLQAWMTVEGLDLKTIGFMTLVGQAYVFKFLWSPLLDRYPLPVAGRWLGRRRGWLAGFQLALAATLGAMALFDPKGSLGALAALAVAVAFLSASQDIVFDAWRTDALLPAERGAGAAVNVMGYRLAMLVSGGLALWLADVWLGFRGTYALMAALMLVGVIGTLMAPEPDGVAAAPPRSLAEAVVGPMRAFFGRPWAVAFLVLIVLYKLGDAFAGALSTSFLIRGVGFSAGEVGLVNKTFGLAATIVGALAGGALMARLGLWRSLFAFGVAQMVSNLAYWALAVLPKELTTMTVAVAIENLCGGMGTAAFVALLTALCERRFSATQYALLSALSAVGRVYVGPASGVMVEAMGWPSFYLSTLAIALPGLALLVVMRGPVRRLEFASPANT
ncbi:AmpG family muropeptide MFS transporter [Derxia gummosa]|uniref:AmpG family muropeptide MFS transporter n=1 Tax=Derxia gummosa DSM 723 TaxID=1121388 RepID=A0A8B6X219_9BURK|nr:MFS transporter [Derxia gummosa]